MTLFDYARNRTTTGTAHPDTSHQAGERVRPKSGTQRARVLDALSNFPMTDEELQLGLSMNPNTQRPRRVELVRDGWVRDSGLRRETVGGDQAIVWEVV